ncbi:PIN domain-containing protein [Brevundimonas sp.]|uniref:PIN domain-containing protein n=1 Tax=Brevundimonas sp. TaxID=1871086 RepID=UPI001D4B2F55|nr:PIN domain-containing protein [Brevundimonas sp.]MBL0947255.1 PIN domain-containing protein [Brevundimonas sp.]
MISIDTNVVVYVSDDDAPRKQETARDLLRAAMQRPTRLGLQVIGELQNVLHRKLKQPPWVAAQNARNLLHAFDTFPASERATEEALTHMATGRLSYWDALLIFSARDAGVTTLVTEDMQDTAVIGGVRILNPFAPDGSPSPALRELFGT